MKLLAHILVFISICILSVVPCFARTITVNCGGGADFNDIQSAINDSNNGDLIIVADGVYTGTNNRNIDFNGKTITLQSENGPETCVIDCENSARGFYFHHNETSTSVVSGFTIQNGFVETFCYGGAGVYFNNSSATITNCIITNNSAVLAPGSLCMCYGGGVCIEESSSPTLTNCVVSNNSSGDWGLGGGISIFSSSGSPVIRNSIISNNSAAAGGGGIYSYQTNNLQISNCTISKNSTNGQGGGVYFYQSESYPISMVNTIVWANDPDQIYTATVYNGYVRASDIQGGWPPMSGPGSINITVDPCFADPLQGDFHLKSAAGRWDPNQYQWVKDSVTSLCIDAGYDSLDFSLTWKNELWPHGKRRNMGAYGGTPEASMSLSDAGNIADLDSNGMADYTDLMLFTSKWLYEENLLSADLDRNGQVDFVDYAVFVDNWLWTE